MIKLYFKKERDVLMIKILGNNITFSNEQLGFMAEAPIDLIKMDYEGILRECPDLADKHPIEARSEYIRRFKELISGMKNEDEIKEYVIDQMTRAGYDFRRIEKAGGFRR